MIDKTLKYCYSRPPKKEDLMRRIIDFIVILFHQWFRLPKPDLVVVVRHGESQTNELYEQGQMQGKMLNSEQVRSEVLSMPDHKVSLTEKGKKQALTIGPKIRELFGVFDVAYHSNYLRAEQTLQGIFTAYSDDEIKQTKMRSNPMLGERQRGYLYDLSEEQANILYPNFPEFQKKFGYFWTRPPGGESQYDVVPRIYSFLGEMFRHRPAQKVLIVCHGGVVRGIRYNLERWTPDQYEEDAANGACHNCSVTTYRRNKKTNQLELESYNQVYY